MFFALLRVVGRLFLALPFIVSGWDTAQEPGGRVDLAANIGVPQPQLAVRANAITMMIAGVALALNLFPRLAAAALAGSMVPTTAAGHPFWQETDPQRRKQQLVHFLKNVSMTGGLLLVAASKRK